MSAPTVHHRIVVGAGMSGLAYAAWAKARGEDVLLLEASARPGGVVRTDVLEGYRAERGPSAVPASAKDLLALAAGLPTPVSFRPAAAEASRPLLLTRAGLRDLPRSPRALWTSPRFGPGATLRILAEALRGPRRPGRSETLAAFVRRRFGVVAAERLLRPLASGIHAASPDLLGAADALPRLAALEQRRGSVLRGLLASRGMARRDLLVPEGGMESLPRALAASLPRQTGTVESLVPAGPASPAAARTADGETFAAREVVLAIPADRQAALLRPHAPVTAEVLGAVRYVPVVVVALGLRADAGPSVPAAFGFLRATGSRARVLGATFLSRLDPSAAPEGCTSMSVFLGGTEDPGVLDLSDDAIRDVVLRDVGRALGGRLRPDVVDVWRWPRAIPLLSPGHRGRVARAAAAVAPLGVRLLGSHVTGVGLAACASAGAPVGDEDTALRYA